MFKRTAAFTAAAYLLLSSISSYAFGISFWKKRDVGLQILAGHSPAEGMINGPVSIARFMEPRDVAVNAAGDIFVADSNAHVIRKISNGVVSTFAGRFGSSGHVNGVGEVARFNYPTGLTIDGAGNLFVAEGNNHTIRKITPDGVVTTMAGSPGSPGTTNGTGAAARFRAPTDITLSVDGNFYITDRDNNRIRKMTPAGVVTTFAGSSGGCDDGTGVAAQFSYPTGIASDSAGNIFVASSSCYTIRKITPAGVVTTFAGQAYMSDAVDGTGGAARFKWPVGLVIDSFDNLYVADSDSTAIRKITSAGVVSNFAGDYNSYGSVDGTGTAAQFSAPTGLSIDTSGNLYVVDSSSMSVRKISPARVATLVAGTHFWDGDGTADGAATAARFFDPAGISADPAGNVYVSDSMNKTIRRISVSGVVTTIAGSPGQEGSADGTGAAARFFYPTHMTVAEDGNIYVLDQYRIRKVTPAGVVTTLAGAYDISDQVDGTGTAARFSGVSGIASDGAGSLYVGDAYAIRKVTLAGVVTTFAGQAGQGYTDGTGSSAAFTRIGGVTVTKAGHIFVADRDNQVIRKITSGGVVTTFAGIAGDSGENDGSGSSARFSEPMGITSDASGNLYVAQGGANVIRKVTPEAIVSTVAGVGPSSPGYTGKLSTSGNRFSEIGFVRDICLSGKKILFVGEDIVKWVPRP